MSDGQIDRRVAEIVGWEYRAGYPQRRVCKHTCQPMRVLERIEDAIAALEAMRERGWEWRIDAQLVKDAPPYWCQLWSPNGKPEETKLGDGDSLPLAICRAIVATQEEK